MKELTVQELQEKIKKVQEDIKNITQEKGREVLTSYVEYLKDELKLAERKQQ
jgi:predicted  nucleic acid-binding Zn-ribbon protein